MKRGIRSETEKIILKRVEQEYEVFKYKMLASPAQNIYDCCHKILFYEIVFEYFRYCKNIEEDYMKACLKENTPIASLWDTYVEYEYLRMEKWEDIEEVLRVLVDRKYPALLPE